MKRMHDCGIRRRIDALGHKARSDIYDAWIKGLSRESAHYIGLSAADNAPSIESLIKSALMGAIREQLEQTKAGTPAKVDYLFRVIKQQFGNIMVCYRGLSENTAPLPLFMRVSTFG